MNGKTTKEYILMSSLVKPHVCYSRLPGSLLRSDSGDPRQAGTGSAGMTNTG